MSKFEEVQVFCPATVANLSCGFDVLGLCLKGVGDEMTIRITDEPGVRIKRISGADLSLEVEQNVAGVAAVSLLNFLKPKVGFEIEIDKKIKPGSGIGSSAASAAGAVYGINKLLGTPLHRRDLIPFAMQGEVLASKAFHADNVAPALLGGFTIVKGYHPLEVFRIDAPDDLYVTLVHPKIELRTADSRAVLPAQLPLKTAVQQSGNLAAFVHALHTKDYLLLGRATQDFIAEPHREKLIPLFSLAKSEALKSGSLGVGISGSGPSIYALCEGKASAQEVSRAWKLSYMLNNIEADVFISQVNAKGTELI